MSNNIIKKKSDNNKRLLITLISVLVIITILYQLKPFLIEDQFSFISVPAFSIIPGILLGYSIIITIKLFKQKNYT